MSRKDLEKIRISDPAYSPLLKEIDNPPRVLYYRGSVPQERYLAVIGSRECTEYGKRVAFDIAESLAEAGITVVSGMAEGIDTSAHRGALEKGGTVAVLGTGVEEGSIYPRSNLELSRRISESGALLSEHPPGTLTEKKHFLQRNRIISGMTEGVVIVEAEARSGSLNTARWARRQGRPLFAVPGPITSSASEGANNLLKEGGFVVTSPHDILKRVEMNHQMKIKSTEEMILKTLSEKPLIIEEIVRRIDLPIPTALSALTELRKKGKVLISKQGLFKLKNV